MNARMEIRRITTIVTCPLRGRLGETQYVQLHPSGEEATEAALLMPAEADVTERQREVFDRYFQLFGTWPVEAGELSSTVLEQLAELVRGDVMAADVLADDAMLMSRWMVSSPEPIIAALDGGTLIARQATDAPAYRLRSWLHRAVGVA